MYKILILTARGSDTISWKERETYIADFNKKANSLAKDYEFFYTTYDDISCVIGEDMVATDHKNNLKLTDYDLVQFKNWHGNLEFASVLARFLDSKNVPIVNREVNTQINTGKLAQAFVFQQNNIPSPRTLYANRSLLATMTVEYLEELGFRLPFVIKQVDGSRGDNNHLCRQLEDMRGVLKNEDEKQSKYQYIIQNFIPNDGDYRLLFVGTDVQPLVFKRRAVGDTHLNNTSKGGEGELVNVRDLPAGYLDSSIQAAKALRCEIAGVDIIANKNTNEYYVLEVNSTPALATGFMIEEKLNRFIDFVKRSVK